MTRKARTPAGRSRNYQSISKSEGTSSRKKRTEDVISLLALPEELLQQICSSLLEVPVLPNQESGNSDDDFLLREDAFLALQSLSKLCRTCRTLNRVGQPYLYRKLDLRPRQVPRLTRTIIKSPDLAKLALSASIEITDDALPHFPRDNYARTADDVRWLQKYVRDERLYDLEETQSLIDTEDVPIDDLFWLVLVEVLLMKLVNLRDLDIEHNLNLNIEILGGRRLRALQQPLLPNLKHLSLSNKFVENAGVLNAIIRQCKLQTLTIVRCKSLELEPGSTPSRSDTVHTLRLINCPYFNDRDISPLITSFPRLRNFQYCTEDPADDDDFDDEAEDLEEMITATDLIRGLEPISGILKSLSITTESLGDDDGFPSIKHFTALEHLHIDAFDLAEYDDDDEDSDNDSGTVAEQPDNNGQTETIVSINNTANQTTVSVDSPQSHTTITVNGPAQISVNNDDTTNSDWEDETNSQASEASSDTSSSSSSSTDTNSPCKPILHLLPASLKTLWIDNLDGLDGGLDGEFIKLANTAKESFPNFQKFTIEGGDELALEDVEKAFTKARIELVSVPFGHTWVVDEGLQRWRGPERRTGSQYTGEDTDEGSEGMWESAVDWRSDATTDDV